MASKRSESAVGFCPIARRAGFVGLALAFVVTPTDPSLQGQRIIPQAEDDLGQTPAVKRAWGPEQATGEPDTPKAGDIQTAWASSTQDGQREWLELEYANAVVPTEIHIYETFNPGAVCEITGYTASGMEAQLWAGTDPTSPSDSLGVSVVQVGAHLKTKRIRIHLISEDVSGWNEIDAVGIKDTKGNMYWAVRATASSTYAERGGLIGAVEIEVLK